MKSRVRAIATVGVLASVIVAFFAATLWFFRPLTPPATVAVTPVPATGPTLGGDIYAKVQSPASGAIPEINPFIAASTDSLDDVYRNPFD